ncbi:unnamed protein product [Cyclocybe aegerita]|uniref:Uncharacterized protein n=1 Tax=Cyclocybe aegerita TaxID=1973307 RepID=A0A8S0XDG0_CYCAE|nr:unnamed protein product [Cyclocybe aegerita]
MSNRKYEMLASKTKKRKPDDSENDEEASKAKKTRGKEPVSPTQSMVSLSDIEDWKRSAFHMQLEAEKIASETKTKGIEAARGLEILKAENPKELEILRTERANKLEKYKADRAIELERFKIETARRELEVEDARIRAYNLQLFVIERFREAGVVMPWTAPFAPHDFGYTNPWLPMTYTHGMVPMMGQQQHNAVIPSGFAAQVGNE